MTLLQIEIGEWGVKTFGRNQTIEGLKKHIEKEVSELLVSPNLQNEKEECADIVILLFGIAHRRGFDLIEEVRNKFQVVQRRKWAEPDENGVIQHIKP